MKQIVLETIQRLTNEKIKNGTFPTHVLWIDLRKELGDKIKEAINQLIEEGKLKAGHTLNDRYLKPLPPYTSKNEERNKCA
jgi:urocanate hydratase